MVIQRETDSRQVALDNRQRRRFHQQCRGILFLLLLCGLVQAQPVRLGIIADFSESELTKAFLEQVESEIAKTLGSSKPLRVSKENIITTNWDYSQTLPNYRELAGRTDLILLLGAGATHEVVQAGSFPVPTISLGIFDTQIQQIPITAEGTSGIENFSYVLTAQELDEELSQFYQIHPFRKLVIIIDRHFSPLLDRAVAQERFARLQSGFSSEIRQVILDDDIPATLAAIPEGCDAIYLAIPYGRSDQEIRQLAEGFIDRKIPSFSMRRQDVSLGIMASISADNDLVQILRKIAIMADEASSGQSLAEMPVALNFREELLVNRNTIEKIDFSLSFETLFTANFIDGGTSEGLTAYGINQIIALALEENLGLRISELDRSLAAQEVRSAKSQFLPSSDLSATAVQINPERASPLAGQAEQTLSGTAGLQQLLFSESALANIKIQSYLENAADAAARQESNDIILDVYSAYFNILRAKTNATIQRENLEASRKNLELARLSASIGAVSQADIFRWESQVANAKQGVIEAFSQLALSKIQLNTLLNGKLGDEFEVAEVSLDDETFQQINENLISDYIKGPREYKILTKFLVSEAMQSNPVKQQLLANEKVLKRQQQLNRRRFFLPTIAASGQVDNVFWRGGEAATPPAGSTYEDLSWNVALNFSIPLFEGGRRKIDLQTSTLQKRQIAYQIQDFDQSLRLALTANAVDLLTAGTNIHFSKIASESAQKNFELVQDNYRNGTASIIALIDAQNSALQARQGYAISVYNYLVAFLTLENTVGNYSLLSTSEQNTAYNNRFKEFVQKFEGKK